MDQPLRRRRRKRRPETLLAVTLTVVLALSGAVAAGVAVQMSNKTVDAVSRVVSR